MTTNEGAASAKLSKMYSTRWQGFEDYKWNVWKILCESFFQKYVPSESTLLDFGAGYGEFIFNIRAREKIAIDLNPHISHACKENNIRFLNQSCTTRWDLDDSSVDVIFSSNFLEHLESKSSIEFVIDECHRVLNADSKSGGILVLIGPNIRFAYNEYWDFWDHHTPMSDRSVRELLRMRGFDILESVDRFLPYAMSGEGRHFTPPLFLVKAYLHMPFVWRFFGKQFLVVASKLR